MLTPDEYMSLMRLISSERESEGASLADKLDDRKPTKKRRKLSAYDKALSKALEEEQSRQRKKNGAFKKGKSAKTVMQAAHKKARRMTEK